MTQQPSQELAPLLDALLDETITPDQHAQLQAILTSSAEARECYFRYIDLHLGLRALHGGAGETRLPEHLGREAPLRTAALRPWMSLRWMGALAAVVAVGMCIGLLTLAAPGRPPARLAEQAGAKFYGPVASLPTGTALKCGWSYALTAGQVRLAFASGAEAIVESPAVFEVAGPMRLVMKAGKCSVHADGKAVGFAVDTPTTHVVDRGTRFSVDVDEAGDALVQVAEGKAEVRPGDGVKSSALFEPQLTRGMARRFVLNPSLLASDATYDAGRFAPALPDRVVRYTTTAGPRGGAGELVDVTVQRSGRAHTYRYEDLIGVKLVHFKGAPSRVHMTTRLSGDDPYLSGGTRAGLLADRGLVTGLINPGGSSQPLIAAPVMNDPEDPAHPNTPGFAVRFNRPVLNGPGPDVVFFELQVVTHPEGGDPFHIAPLAFGPGLHAHPVRRYDIDLLSPEATSLEPFRIYKFDRPVNALGDLERLGHNGGTEHAVPAKLLAVGIDLSDLGYEPGAKVEGLFFQDAMDDDNYVDPVLIGGLPE